MGFIQIIGLIQTAILHKTVRSCAKAHGWTHEEAAELLGVPLGTLKSTVARAKAKCRALWSGGSHG